MPLAENGDADAQYNLGIIYIYGDEVLQDYTQAAYWTKKAYENPNASNEVKNMASEKLGKS